MNKLMLLAAIAALVVPIGGASACRVNRAPEERISNAYKRSGVERVLLVRVNDARYTADRKPDWHPWQATAVVTQTLKGSPQHGEVQFGRTGSTAACDDGIPVPNKNDEWIVYIVKWNGRPEVGLSYPIEVAYRADPALSDLCRDRLAGYPDQPCHRRMLPFRP